MRIAIQLDGMATVLGYIKFNRKVKAIKAIRLSEVYLIVGQGDNESWVPIELGLLDAKRLVDSIIVTITDGSVPRITHHFNVEWVEYMAHVIT